MDTFAFGIPIKNENHIWEPKIFIISEEDLLPKSSNFFPRFAHY